MGDIYFRKLTSKILYKVLQGKVQHNNHRGFPPKENSSKTELTHLNCVQCFMLRACSAQSLFKQGFE